MEYGPVFFDRNCMFSHDFLTIMYYVTKSITIKNNI